MGRGVYAMPHLRVPGIKILNAAIKGTICRERFLQAQCRLFPRFLPSSSRPPAAHVTPPALPYAPGEERPHSLLGEASCVSNARRVAARR